MKTLQAVESQFRELSRCESATSKPCQILIFVFCIFSPKKYAKQLKKPRKTGRAEQKDMSYQHIFHTKWHDNITKWNEPTVDNFKNNEKVSKKM